MCSFLFFKIPSPLSALELHSRHRKKFQKSNLWLVFVPDKDITKIQLILSSAFLKKKVLTKLQKSVHFFLVVKGLLKLTSHFCILPWKKIWFSLNIYSTVCYFHPEFDFCPAVLSQSPFLMCTVKMCCWFVEKLYCRANVLSPEYASVEKKERNVRSTYIYFFLASGGGSPLYPEILRYYTMILQRISASAHCGTVDTGFEPGTSAWEVWRTTNEPPHLQF